MSRGQIGADFMIISGVVLLAFLALLEIYLEQSQSTRILYTQIAALRVSDDVARTIDHVWLAGNGSVGHVHLPDSLPNGLPYNLTIRGRRVLVVYAAGTGERTAGAGMVTSNVTTVVFTQMPPGGGKRLNITNLNGTVNVVG